jgi:alkanesulfonate monooxygenase SsuD/methylene tetrahydromethanopterin reductase-like flavin-dependent oxidoreductase (luciferase family)
MGLPPVPLGTVRDYIQTCRALLPGEEVLYREEKRERWIKFLHPDHGYVNLKDPIPIYLAANGPKALALTGELADGWLTTLSDPASFKKNLTKVEQGAAQVGRKIPNFPIAVLSTGCVLRPGESITSSRVIERVGPLAVVALHALWEQSAVATDLPPALQDLYGR